MRSVERLHAERVNSYHYRSPTTRGRVDSRHERHVDAQHSGGPSHICIRLQHHRIALPDSASASTSPGWRNRNPPVGNG